MRCSQLALLALLILCGACASTTNGSGAPPDGGTADTLVPDRDVPSTDGTIVRPMFDVPRLDGQTPPHDATALDAAAGDVTNHYDVAPHGDAPACDAGPACSPRPTGCAAREICNDGLDNDCNGRVDESCPCIPGAVERCFLGPPGARHVGACTDGNQTCVGVGEFGQWGACQGGISPSAEVCDHLDNDCNGCADNGLCCTMPGSCPGPGDPRIPSGVPFGTVALHGAPFAGVGATSFHWHIVGGPCDQMLFDTSMHLSYALNHPAGATGGDTLDADGEAVQLYPTLSGDYTVVLTIGYADGRTLTCTFIVPVRAPGLRAELCWDTTGRDDVDFWLHNPHTRGDWGQYNFGDPAAPANSDTCAYYNCRNQPLAPILPRINWGYPDTAGASCREPDVGVCHTPRLDIDNIATAGIPENINVDRPNTGDRFRIAVNYYGGSSRPSPMVNIYCGGQLRATFGGYDTRRATHIGATPVARFARSGQNARGTVWRVADVSVTGADTCDVHAMHPAGMSAGYCVDTSTNRSFDGPCSVAP